MGSARFKGGCRREKGLGYGDGSGTADPDDTDTPYPDRGGYGGDGVMVDHGEWYKA